MVKRFETDKNKFFLSISKNFCGIGISINLLPPFHSVEYQFSLNINLLFIQFWWDAYKKNEL